MTPEAKPSLLQILKSLLMALLGNMLRDIARLVIAFAIGTAAAGLCCYYYNIPLVFSVLGGCLVLGVTLAFAVLV